VRQHTRAARQLEQEIAMKLTTLGAAVSTATLIGFAAPAGAVNADTLISPWDEVEASTVYPSFAARHRADE
jgi:hypothetical protein